MVCRSHTVATIGQLVSIIRCFVDLLCEVKLKISAQSAFLVLGR